MEKQDLVIHEGSGGTKTNYSFGAAVEIRRDPEVREKYNLVALSGVSGGGLNVWAHALDEKNPGAAEAYMALAARRREYIFPDRASFLMRESLRHLLGLSLPAEPPAPVFDIPVLIEMLEQKLGIQAPLEAPFDVHVHVLDPQTRAMEAVHLHSLETAEQMRAALGSAASVYPFNAPAYGKWDAAWEGDATALDFLAQHYPQARKVWLMNNPLPQNAWEEWKERMACRLYGFFAAARYHARPRDFVRGHERTQKSLRKIARHPSAVVLRPTEHSSARELDERKAWELFETGRKHAREFVIPALLQDR